MQIVVEEFVAVITARLPLPLNRDTSLKFAEIVSHIGFPGPTYDRQKVLGKPDSDGTSQLMSYGPILENSEYLRRTGKDAKNIKPEILELLTNAHIYSDADSYVGMSGAPTLNSKGEVIGMVIGSFPADGSASNDTSVVSIRSSFIFSLIGSK